MEVCSWAFAVGHLDGSGISRVHRVCHICRHRSVAALWFGGMCAIATVQVVPLSAFTGLLVLSSPSSLKSLFILNISLIQL